MSGRGTKGANKKGINPGLKRKSQNETKEQVKSSTKRKKLVAPSSQPKQPSPLEFQNSTGECSYLPTTNSRKTRSKSKIKDNNNNARPVSQKRDLNSTNDMLTDLSAKRASKNLSNKRSTSGQNKGPSYRLEFNDRERFNNIDKQNREFVDAVDSEDDGINVTIHASGDEFEEERSDDEDYYDREDGELDGQTDDDELVQIQPVPNVNMPNTQELGNREAIKRKLSNDPYIQGILSELVDEKIENQASGGGNKQTNRTPVRTPIRDKSKSNSTQKQGVTNTNIIKSPSDTTLYTPALKKGIDKLNLIDRISDFVEGIRLETTGSNGGQRSLIDNRRDDMQPRSVVNKDAQEAEILPSTPRVLMQPTRVEPSTSRAKEGDNTTPLPDKFILDAERLKASLVAPAGLFPGKIDSNIKLLRNLDNDDDFFHTSCHVDPAIKAKIEKGQFVELDKLLPREDGLPNLPGEEDFATIQLVSVKGQRFLAPPPKQRRINSVRRWDQAFRIYAMVYVQANPDRSGEILQYVDVIHTAASNYSWDNVAFYDHTFRQLMAAKPWRSWAKTYSQGWNIALRGNNRISVNSMSSNNNSAGGSNNNNGKSWKDDCCWRFGKGKCNRGSECRYDHRCTFCAGWGHGFNACRKRTGSGGNQSQNKPSSSTQSNGSAGYGGNRSNNNNKKI